MSTPAKQPIVLTPDPTHSTAFVQAWSAQSRRHEGIRYTVKYDRLENAFTCQCPGHTYRGHCAHIDQAITELAAQWRKGRAA